MHSVFLLLLILSLLLISSSYSWFVSWVGLELMTFFFLPLLSSKDDSFSGKLTLWKYLVVQFMSSSLFFLFMLLDLSFFSTPTTWGSNMINMMLLISMFLKLGMPPFHGWMFEISENMTWFNFFLLNTLQKLGPLVVLWNSSVVMSKMLIVVTSMSVMFTLFCMFDLSLRRFLTFSSILNVAWMLLSIYVDLGGFYFYYLSYFMIMMGVTILLMKCKSPTMSHLNSYISFPSFYTRIAMVLTILSLCGVPPLLGFAMKFEIMLGLTEMNIIPPCVLLMICSILMVSSYINIMLAGMLARKSKFNTVLSEKRHFNLTDCFIIFIQILPTPFYFM